MIWRKFWILCAIHVLISTIKGGIKMHCCYMNATIHGQNQWYQYMSHFDILLPQHRDKPRVPLICKDTTAKTNTRCTENGNHINDSQQRNFASMYDNKITSLDQNSRDESFHEYGDASNLISRRHAINALAWNDTAATHNTSSASCWYGHEIGLT